MNPIFRREFLARWRDWRSHALLLILALLLSGSAYWAYQNALSYSPQIFPTTIGSGKQINYIISPTTRMLVPFVPESLATRASRTGHTLFSTLALANVGVWFVLAPMLLATGVAREREHGLLESLQLSPMRPASQIAARMLSALSFLAALQLVTLPVYWIAFSFGGVSPGEIKQVWEIVAAAAFCGIGLGLMLSAQAHRPSSALFGVVVVLALWSAIAWAGHAGASSPSGFLGLGSSTLTFCEVLYYSHPLALVMQLLDPLTLRAPTYYVPGPPVVTPTVGGGAPSVAPALFPITPVYWTALQVLPVASLAWLVVGALGLLKATRDVTRAFAPSEWAKRNTLIGKWKEQHEKRLQEQRAKRVSVEGALLADLPFERLIRFKNPLLNREVKSRFRLRRGSLWSWAGRTVVFLVGAGAWLMVMFSVFLDPIGRAGAVPAVLLTEWLLGVTLVGIWASGAFAREREAGTWEALQLSLLGSGDITRTKWASPLVSFAFWTCPLWLLLFALVPIGSWKGVEFRWVALGAGVVVASLSLVSALASWISLRARSSTHATCWTLGVLLALFWGVPTISDALGVPDALAKWRYGVPAYDPFNSNIYDQSNSPQYKALYQKETGRSVPNNSMNYNWREMGLYQTWFRDRQMAATSFETMVGAWNPLTILSQFNHRKSSTPNYYRQTGTVDDDILAKMSLLHIALSLAGTLGFLLLVRRALDDTGTRRRFPSANKPRHLEQANDRAEGAQVEASVVR
jgi:ABC-type transport system involved in multi-copper enzyme maturation permease subunit